jgi:hypothetical protein
LISLANCRNESVAFVWQPWLRDSIPRWRYHANHPPRVPRFGPFGLYCFGECDTPQGLVLRQTHRPVTPIWNKNTRELWYGGECLKKFTKVGEYSELILSAFEEQKWKQTIDNPISPDSGTRPTDECNKDRLRRTAETLCKAVGGTQGPFGFFLDGTGQRISWRPR